MPKVKRLYRITQDKCTGYDTYSDAIVCATSEDEAKLIHPHEYFNSPEYDYGLPWYEHTGRWDFDSWPLPEFVTATLVGLADDSVELGEVLCASFHAG